MHESFNWIEWFPANKDARVVLRTYIGIKNIERNINLFRAITKVSLQAVYNNYLLRI